MNKLLTKWAVNILRKSLKDDPDYEWSWICNIAVCMQDAYKDAADKTKIHKISNDGAERFMKLLES